MTNIFPVPHRRGKVKWQGWAWDKEFRVPAGVGGRGLWADPPPGPSHTDTDRVGRGRKR